MGKNKYIITYPISGGKLINTVALVSKPELNGTIYDGPLVEDVSRAELMNNFVGWEPQVQTILGVSLSEPTYALAMMTDTGTLAYGKAIALGDQLGCFATVLCLRSCCASWGCSAYDFLPTVVQLC